MDGAADRQVEATSHGTRGELKLEGRLGLDVAAGWPSAPMLKSQEAAGFGWVQIRTPPAPMLRERDCVVRHAAALSGVLDTSGLRLIIHGPDDLSAGRPGADRALDGLLDYAELAGAEYVVYHGANFPLLDGAAAAARTRDRVTAEESALRARVPRLEAAGLTLVIENLAPVWPAPPRLCHSPRVVRELVDRLESPRVGLLFDVGHAQIAGALLGTDAAALLEPVLDAVLLFHVHDNLGARIGEPMPALAQGRRDDHNGAASPWPMVPAAAVDPLLLDLHLPPGAGRVPWERLAPTLVGHGAPLMLEIASQHRPEPLALAAVTSALLLRHALDSGNASGPRPAATVPAVEAMLRRA